MLVARCTRSVFGLVAAKISTAAMAIASMTATVTMSNMSGSCVKYLVEIKLAAERDQGLQIPVAQPQPAPYHQAEIKPEQRVREQGAADPHMRGHGAAEIAGEQDRAEDRGRRNRIEHGADDGDEAKAPRHRFTRTIAHPVHGFGDDRPRHQLDGA